MATAKPAQKKGAGGKAASENSRKTAKGRPFAKGQSGNPGGRPKKTEQEWELIAACKARTPDALNVMLRIMQDGQNERNQLAAAQAIIERAYGKAQQSMTLSGDPDKPLVTKVVREIVRP